MYEGSSQSLISISTVRMSKAVSKFKSLIRSGSRILRRMASLDIVSSSIDSFEAWSIKLMTVTTEFDVCLEVIYAFLYGRLVPLNYSLKASKHFVI